LSDGPDFRHVVREWSPWYLKGEWGGKLLDAVGGLLNGLADQVDQGERAGNPLQCQADAFPHHSRDRQIEAYTNEPDASKRYRLSRWWQLHARQGTHLGQMANLQPYFLPGTLPKIRVVHADAGLLSSTWWTMNADGTVERYVKTPCNWNWDGTGVWARSWVIIYTEGTALDASCAKYGDGTTFGDGTLYGGLTALVRSELVRLVKSWKSGHEQVWGVALARDPASFDPTATAVTLGDGTTTLPVGNWLRLINPLTGLRTRVTTATWIYDRTRDGA
jgi:hypothetical protein